jgi:hypothetical protein
LIFTVCENRTGQDEKEKKKFVHRLLSVVVQEFRLTPTSAKDIFTPTFWTIRMASKQKKKANE